MPYHVTTLQNRYGPIPLLPMTTSDRMEAKPVFPEQSQRRWGARKSTGTHQIEHKEHTKICVSYVVIQVILL